MHCPFRIPLVAAVVGGVLSIAAPITAQSTGPIGSTYCISFPNSTGNIAEISAFGSLSAPDQSTVFMTGPVPNTVGLHYFGSQQVFLPFGIAGVRCVGGQLFRMQAVTAAGGTAVQDAFSQNANAAVYFVPGTTWNVQYWFRDPGGPVATQLSNAMTITYL